MASHGNDLDRAARDAAARGHVKCAEALVALGAARVLHEDDVRVSTFTWLLLVTYLLQAVIIVALGIAGVFLPIFEIFENERQIDITIWKMCSNYAGRVRCTKTDDLSPSCLAAQFRVIGAFGIMSILVAFLIAVPIAFLQWLKNLRIKLAPFAMLATAVVLAIFTLIPWAIIVGLYEQGCGEQRGIRNWGFGYGPAFLLFVVAWLLSLCMVGVSVMNYFETETIRIFAGAIILVAFVLGVPLAVLLSGVA